MSKFGCEPHKFGHDRMKYLISREPLNVVNHYQQLVQIENPYQMVDFPASPDPDVKEEGSLEKDHHLAFDTIHNESSSKDEFKKENPIISKRWADTLKQISMKSTKHPLQTPKTTRFK